MPAPSGCRFSRSLAPYAQALKHVALRGAVAFGPTVRETELQMYRQGILPADYRPPVQGRWDDTIERWAYAWQFPAEEVEESEEAAVAKNSHGMSQLISFTQSLLEGDTPLAATPHSGIASTRFPSSPETIADQRPQLGASTASSSQEGSAPSGPALPADELLLAMDSTSLEALQQELEQLGHEAPAEAAAAAAAAARNEPLSRRQASMGAMIPAAQYAATTSIPVAYLDDGSEQANASKVLGGIMESALGLEYTEEGLCIALSALSQNGLIAEARALFDFVSRVGLGGTPEQYRSLMKYASFRGDVNTAMALIEEMKEKGVTPRIGNWHELMKTFINAGDYPAVTQIVDNMKMYANLEPSEVTFALQLRALAKDQSQLSTLPEAVQLFDQMENVYGFIASRPHYDALLSFLCQSPKPEMRLRCEELAKKMEIMGIVWNSRTYLWLIRSAQVAGDVQAVEALFAKMRNDGVPMTLNHLAWAVHAHTQAMIRMDYARYKEEGQTILPVWLEHFSTAFGLYDLILQRGWKVEGIFLNALLRLCCQATSLAMEHLPDDTQTMGRFETHANELWQKSFDQWGVAKDVYSYECYISLLAFQQRMDEAEKNFQQLVLDLDCTPSRRTYECLLFMHLSSGEEGGTARALRYLEAMERAKIPIRPSLVKKMVRVNNAAGYKRDMKRRARRIMQAREEYMARKEEGVDLSRMPYAPPTRDEAGNLVLVPLPVSTGSTLAWWEKWKRESKSKHELFSTEHPDGTPRGDSFEEKNQALEAMGITSRFREKSDLPDPSRHRLLPALREAEGEVAGGIWALDGGELAYPKDGGGPEGWGVRLWRERQLIRKEFQKSLDGQSPVAPFSELGKGARGAADQLAIEASGATTPGELADYRQFPEEVFDDGTMKPASELAVKIPHSAELVWNVERGDQLAPYKTDDELAPETNTFYADLRHKSGQKVDALIDTLKNKQEFAVDIRGQGVTRKSKHDYLAKWREMYRHGTLDVPEKPVLQFGRTPHEHRDSLAATVRDWYARSGKSPLPESAVQQFQKDEERAAESRASRQHKRQRRPHRR